MFKKLHIFRVKPGQELYSEISGYCRGNNLTSGVVLGIIGSLQSARLSFIQELPARYDSLDYSGPLEIVCAQGSVALKDGEIVIHIHMQISLQEMSRGGHLDEAVIFSTAEVVIGELDYQLSRQTDSYTGLNELTA
jgi:predicted DNA-binding protein with PD1-like motif